MAEEEKIDTKQNEEFKISWMIWICISIVIGLVVIGGGVFGVIENDFPSNGSNDGWLSFFGSYIGGAFSGISAIIALFVTIIQTRKIQAENKKENRHYQFQSSQLTQSIQDRNERITRELQNENMKIQIKQMDISFTNDISEHVAVYLTDINVYFWTQYIDKGEANRVKSVEMWHLLHIKLDKIDEAKQLLNSLDKIHREYCFIDRTEDKATKVFYSEKFQKECNLLITLTTEFVNNYSSKKNEN